MGKIFQDFRRQFYEVGMIYKIIWIFNDKIRKPYHYGKQYMFFNKLI